jgi:hypothetical protein
METAQHHEQHKHQRRHRRHRIDLAQYVSTILWIGAIVAVAITLIWGLGDVDFGDVKIRAW